MPSEAVRTEQAGRVYDWAKQGAGGTVSPRGLKGEFLEMPIRYIAIDKGGVICLKMGF
ncbi:hypothetical protein SAMN06275492_10836 [Dethiosulfovibrio salsuginis]|uniref:Uncharacterized protein n=1 Tax=Dethiosulfovibrio salsuginis TaxID=561720 RepID=A0A1X7J3Y6_9BACT|nr:hypothetical protein SAMN06275492_10836 [Dethiosulfovibrio salsuginis]